MKKALDWKEKDRIEAKNNKTETNIDTAKNRHNHSEKWNNFYSYLAQVKVASKK